MPGLYGSETAKATLILPETMVIGDSWSFSLYSGQYGEGVSDGPWTANITFASGTARLTDQAEQSGSVFNWTILPEQTSTLAPGPCFYMVQMDNGTLRRTLDQGAVTLIADISVPGAPVNASSILEQQLAAADACLMQLLSQRTQMVSFGGKQYQLWDVAKLWQVRNGIYARVLAERERNSGNMRARLIVPYFREVI